MERLVRGVRALPEGRPPWAPGVVVLAGRGPVVAAEAAAGWALRYRAWDPERERGLDLPRDLWEPMRVGTVFDLASLSKLFTAIAAVQQIERGRLALDDEVRADLPAFAPGITVRRLLTHTSGLAPELPFHDHRTRAAQLALLWTEAAAPSGRPGAAHRYSDLNLIALQLLLEQRTGHRLDALIRDGITGPLDMSSTTYGPLAPQGVAATEDQRRPWAKADRGLVRGEVHDENAWALGGVAGHAGLFSTAQDLAVLCRTLLNGGAYGTARILGPDAVAALLDPPGLGFGVDQPYFMGELAGRGAAGHTGFTGTSLVLDRATDTFLVLLANTVHPRRHNGGSAPRAAAATRLARAVSRAI
ncbi:CubicO group peptidase, beta-lactamase class C family [Streptomyces sp. 2224.1]|uniref:serine hydrolase domain-containing protein n=1 Tax=Streptomyces sp. 2224.1 TaxID=1881020 RepID=UPI00089B2FFC|nr:serine hydrolase [Streptomyces sp. 2224.1]SEC60367.1 CubicO group peptidase, beta-lactamase class C family [Streptomyces sp. 2224.1]